MGSCEKEEKVYLDEPLSIQSAKTWFESTIGNRKARTTGSEDVKNALWEKAAYKDFGFGKVAVIPIKYEKPTYPSFSEDGMPTPNFKPVVLPTHEPTLKKPKEPFLPPHGQKVD